MEMMCILGTNTKFRKPSNVVRSSESILFKRFKFSLKVLGDLETLFVFDDLEHMEVTSMHQHKLEPVNHLYLRG